SLYLILTRNFTSRNRQEVNIVAAGAALAIDAGLNWVLIPRWGSAGAAVSTAVSYSTAALILLVVFARESGYGIAKTLFIGRADLDGYRQLAARMRVLAPGPADEISEGLRPSPPRAEPAGPRRPARSARRRAPRART